MVCFPSSLFFSFSRVVPRSQVEKNWIEFIVIRCSVYVKRMRVCASVSALWTIPYIFICMASSWELATWFVEVFHHVILCFHFFLFHFFHFLEGFIRSFVRTCTSTCFSIYLFIIIISFCFVFTLVHFGYLTASRSHSLPLHRHHENKWAWASKLILFSGSCYNFWHVSNNRFFNLSHLSSSICNMRYPIHSLYLGCECKTFVFE